MKAELNSIFKGLRGKIGDYVFKQVNGKTVICYTPKRKRRKPTLTDGLIKQRAKFSEAVAYAREIISNPVLKEKYAKIAKEKNLHGAYNAAIKEFMGSTVHSRQTTDDSRS